MKTIVINDTKIEFYDTAENMTMKRYQRFNKFVMIDNEVGSDFAAFDTRLTKALRLLKKGMEQEGFKELANWRQMVYNSFMEYSPQNMALALLVHSIDGETFTDITATGLQKVLDRLEEVGFTQRQAIKEVQEVKKK